MSTPGRSRPSSPDLRTDRLQLRSWRDDDLEPFAALNRDPQVMRHFRAPLSREESDAFADRIRERIASDGWGLWAVEVIGGAPFIGFIGLARPQFDAHFTPAVEVGWRLAHEHWGNGYAPEGARAALDFAFQRIGLAEVVSMTVPGNVKSRRVMEKLGMSYDPADDFDNPTVPIGHALRRNVLYRTKSPRGQTPEPTSP
jgi:RimJ/RimL family protein N-acetyltransferase